MIDEERVAFVSIIDEQMDDPPEIRKIRGRLNHYLDMNVLQNLKLCHWMAALLTPSMKERSKVFLELQEW